MILTVDEFIRRFPLHVLPASLHRIRHYGMLGNTARKDTWRARELLMRKKTDPSLTVEVNAKNTVDSGHHDAATTYVCPHCGAAMVVLETLVCGHPPARTSCRGDHDPHHPRSPLVE